MVESVWLIGKLETPGWEDSAGAGEALLYAAPFRGIVRLAFAFVAVTLVFGLVLVGAIILVVVADEEACGWRDCWVVWD